MFKPGEILRNKNYFCIIIQIIAITEKFYRIKPIHGYPFGERSIDKTLIEDYFNFV
jgi:hypothetical protein